MTASEPVLNARFAIPLFGARGVDFRGWDWPLDEATVSWIQWDSGKFEATSASSEERPPIGLDEPDRLEWAPGAGRLIITVHEASSEDEALRRAHRILDIFLGLFTLHFVFNAIGMLGDDPEPFPIAADDVVDGVFIVDRALARLGEGPSTGDWMRQLREFGTFGEAGRLLKAILDRVQRVDDDELLYEALGFWRSAFRHYAFVGDEVSLTMSDPSWVPPAQAHRIQFEESVVNALKALEALNDWKFKNTPGGGKFIAALAARGIDTNRPIYFPGEHHEGTTHDGRLPTLGARLHHLFTTRNERAAHGYDERPLGTPRSRMPVTLYEVMEAQYATQHALADVLDLPAGAG